MTNEQLRNTLSVMLRPVVRFCLQRGVGIAELFEVLKDTFVGVASAEISQRGEKVNVSRVSVITGLHRRDVTRLLQLDGPPLEKVNIISKVINTWENAGEFSTKAGKPRVLSFEGEKSDFTKLVRSITKDVHAKGVLLQLEQLDIVERTPSGIKLKGSAQDVRSDLAKGYHVLSQDLEDLSLGVEQNLRNQNELPNLHARTEFDNVFEDSIPKVRAWLLKEGSSFHQRARAFLSTVDQDMNPHIRKTAGVRIALTSFSRVDVKRES